MLENIKLVIFDLDGVIADTEPLHFFAKSMILQNLGLNNKIDINAFIGKPNQEFWELALRGSEISISYEDLETRQDVYKRQVPGSYRTGQYYCPSGIKQIQVLYQHIKRN